MEYACYSFIFLYHPHIINDDNALLVQKQHVVRQQIFVFYPPFRVVLVLNRPPSRLVSNLRRNAIQN